MENARFSAEDRLFAEFYYFAVKNSAKTLEEGRDIFEEKAYVKIIVPGDRDNIVCRPVRDMDKQRFPQQWKAFESNQEQPIEGTLLSEWNGVSISLAKELAFFGVKTVEALAEMADTNVSKMMGGYALKKKAQDFMEDATLKAPYEKAIAENERLESEIEVMKDQIAELMKKKTKKK